MKKKKIKKDNIDIKKVVNPVKLKSLGITKEILNSIDVINGQDIIGGKNTDPTVKTQWPTNNI